MIEIAVSVGFARLANGEHLLAEIRSTPKLRHIPVIVMTGYGSDGPSLAVRLMKKGAVDFVNKPFNNDALDRAILDALGRKHEQSSPLPPTVPKQFDGGIMTFFSNAVELCGVRIVSGNRINLILRILNALRQKRESGKYLAFEGSELAKLVKCRGGQNGVAGAIRNFRANITKIMQDELAITVGQQDVIRSGGQGYRLADWIETKTADENAVTLQKDFQCQAEHDTGNANRDTGNGTTNDTANDDDGTANRREQIIEQIRLGTNTQAPAIALAIGYSLSTVKRDLEVLKANGTITFNGPTKTGGYRLQTQPQQTQPQRSNLAAETSNAAD